MISVAFEKKASKVLSVIGNPFRIKIIMAIGKGEACVCHLEAILNKRQAYISQHLMALRNAGLLKTRRDGKYIFYRLSNQEIINLIRNAGLISGLEPDHLPMVKETVLLKECICPHCESENLPNRSTSASIDATKI